jgi:hypothetical protein
MHGFDYGHDGHFVNASPEHGHYADAHLAAGHHGHDGHLAVPMHHGYGHQAPHILPLNLIDN